MFTLSFWATCVTDWITISFTFSPHVRKSGFQNPSSRNTAQGIQNPTNDWNPESKFHLQRLESRTWDSGIHNVESRIQDSLGFPYMGRTFASMCAQQNKYYLSKTRSILSLDPSQGFLVLASTPPPPSPLPALPQGKKWCRVNNSNLHSQTVDTIKLMCWNFFIIKAI